MLYLKMFTFLIMKSSIKNNNDTNIKKKIKKSIKTVLKHTHTPNAFVIFII